MNDTLKGQISEKLNRQIEAGNMMVSTVARNLGILNTYASMIRNPAQWHKCSKSAWEAANDWYNSGQKLSEYSTAHGRVVIPELKTGRELIDEARREVVAAYEEEVRRKKATPPLKSEPPESGQPITAPLAVKPVIPKPIQQFTDTARLKVALDIEINLVVNGKKVEVK